MVKILKKTEIYTMTPFWHKQHEVKLSWRKPMPAAVCQNTDKFISENQTEAWAGASLLLVSLVPGPSGFSLLFPGPLDTSSCFSSLKIESVSINKEKIIFVKLLKSVVFRLICRNTSLLWLHKMMFFIRSVAQRSKWQNPREIGRSMEISCWFP